MSDEMAIPLNLLISFATMFTFGTYLARCASFGWGVVCVCSGCAHTPFPPSTQALAAGALAGFFILTVEGTLLWIARWRGKKARLRNHAGIPPISTTAPSPSEVEATAATEAANTAAAAVKSAASTTSIAASAPSSIPLQSIPSASTASPSSLAAASPLAAPLASLAAEIEALGVVSPMPKPPEVGSICIVHRRNVAPDELAPAAKPLQHRENKAGGEAPAEQAAKEAEGGQGRECFVDNASKSSRRAKLRHED